MAYQTGTSSGTSDLLDKLNTFAVAAGWTLDRRDADSLSLTKNNVHVNLYSGTAGQIKLQAALAFSSGAAWNAQSGHESNTQICTDLSGSFTAYHFFADQDYIHAVVEVDPGTYRHFAFGELAKSSGYTGGQYCCATAIFSGTFKFSLFGGNASNIDGNLSAANALYLTVDAVSAWYYFNAGNLINLNSSEPIFSKKFFYNEWLANASPNTLNGLAAFASIQPFVNRPSGYTSPVGYVRDLRVVNIANIDPGATKTIGSHDWLIFPVLEKGGISANWGYAYKKIP